MIRFASLDGEPERFIALVRDLGIRDGMRIALQRVGIQTAVDAEYPGLGQVFRVSFDPTWRWIQRGVREPGVIKFVEENVRPGQVVVDVGAHVGEYALLFSYLTRPSGRVVAFEPDQAARKILSRNLAENPFGNVEVEGFFVGDKAGRAVLTSDRLGSGLASASKGSDSARRRSFEVDGIRLDSYCESRGIRPDFVKIDVEGAESLVLDGMSRIIAGRPPTVILEFHANAMTEVERRASWETITRAAKKVQYLNGDYEKFQYLEELPLHAPPGDKLLIACVRF